MARRFLSCVCVLLATAAAQAQTGADPQGKVIAVSGKVEHTPAKQEQWNSAKLFQPLLVAERVRTLTASRAAVLFIDETQVKLNAGAVLTIQQVRREGGAPTSLELERGEAWFRTKNPGSGLTVRTPAAAAAVRGTEVNVVVQPDNTTVLTVVEGSVEFSNTAGAILVNAGEEGTARPGEAPTKRVLLNPDDAVQWVLYYPIEAEWNDLPAAQLLASGDVVGARQAIATAIAANASDIRPLLLLASIELRQNHADRAAEAAARALSLQPDSAIALVTAAEAAQAQFDLRAAERYLDRALARDPRSVRALVNRARIRFGTGRTDAAKADAEAAVAIAPDDAQVLSLRGFIRLADGEGPAARADFEASAARDPEFGEPHLGLGLLHFRQNRANEGLLELLTATLLEPKVSLYQSYLGKAYYQVERFPEGLSALNTAKRLDPRDPTPWLYSSLYLRDQNRQTTALEELRQAIALNDNRAVYRGRLLLDRDLATKNVSLAEIYRQLGFEAWGAYEALNSLDADYTNASAHLFLADTYGRLPDRLQALSSELLQYFVYAPVNRNSFNNFAEYTALLEQPRQQFAATIETGSRDRLFGNVTHRTGNERWAHAAFFQSSREDGPRADRIDDRWQGFFQGKLALGDKSDLFMSVVGVRRDEGASEQTSKPFGLETGAPVLLRQFTTPNPLVTDQFTLVESAMGFRHTWRPGTSLTAAIRYEDIEQRTENIRNLVSACRGLELSQFGAHSQSRIVSPFESLEVQIQQTATLGRHQLIVGQQIATVDKESRCAETLFDSESGLEVTRLNSLTKGTDQSAISYLRDEVELLRWLHVSVGASYQQVEFFDTVANKPTDTAQWSPLAGVAVRLSPTTVLRGAAFRNLNTRSLGARLAPPTVSGFVIERNEFETTEREEVNVSLERSGRRTFAGVRAFRRDVEIPIRFEFIPEADARYTGANGYLNWIVAPRVSLAVDHQFVKFSTPAFTRYDNLSRAVLNFIHERGLFVRLTGSYVTQEFTETAIAGLPRSEYALADASVSYEFGRKRGLVAFSVTNAFNEKFDSVLEGLSIDLLVPRRRALLSLTWRVF